jgi:acyl transferase domain-containing protein/acyl carrier protein
MSSPGALAVFEEVAVIGMAGRFPSAESIDELWRNLRDGVESVVSFSDEELLAAGVDQALLADPHYVKSGTVVGGPDLFDAAFFGFNPREAEITDPQHRLFLEHAHQALELAGYDPQTYGGLIGVFAGSTMSTYLANNLYRNPLVIESVSPLQVLIGNDKDFVSTRVSYKLNLKGPSVNVQTACSTSLVAVHLACQSLLERVCDLALAGGVSIHFPQRAGYPYEEEGILSPDGHCRAFDAKARGAVGGNGVALVVLKRLSEALADGDRILAKIKGSAINNDGSQKVGYTAPSVDGQSEVIVSAHALAGVDPNDISYVEAHGTGTLLGDPIEIAALTEAFRAAPQRSNNFCAIGSVKTNLGHMDAAAGVTGLIKTVLQLQHRTLVPSLNFEEPNPRIDFPNSPFYVNTKLQQWKRDKGPRRAGVSSFGLGGTNAHVVLEEAPEPEPSGPSRPLQLLTISAKTGTALDRATANLAAHLRENPDANLADLAFTLHVGRTAYGQRRVVVSPDKADATAVLEGKHPDRLWTYLDAPIERRVVFMFPGGGAQYANMGRGLYEHESVYRDAIDRCAKLFRLPSGSDLREILYPPAEQFDAATAQLRQTGCGLPALFSTEYAQAMLWMSWGVRPASMIGHSLGEYVAACLAGVFTLEDAITLVEARSRLMETLPRGAMVVVPLREPEIAGLLGPDLSIAANNGPALFVVSGRREAIERFELALAERGGECHRLPIDVASHCPLVAPILGEFREIVTRLRRRAPEIPYLSNVTGRWITEEQVLDPNYWVDHLRGTVRFADGLEELFTRNNLAMLEVGPGNTLSMLANQHPSKTGEHLVVSSQRHPRDAQPDLRFLANSLAQLWLAGTKVDWAGYYQGERRQRLLLPTYPFERQSYWVAPLAGSNYLDRAPSSRRPDLADCFYVPVWKQSVAARVKTRDVKPQVWLVFADKMGVADRLIAALRKAGHQVVWVFAGTCFSSTPQGEFTIDPNQADHYDLLLKHLGETHRLPSVILHMWSVTSLEPRQSIDLTLNLGFYSLLSLAQAIGSQGVRDPLRLRVITNNSQRVVNERTVSPEKALVLGVCRVVPQEYPNVEAHNIDIDLASFDEQNMDATVDVLLRQCSSGAQNTLVAVRDADVWFQDFQAVHLPASAEKSPLRQGGVYLITGGLGGMALEMAEYLARSVNAKLALVGRSAFPRPEEWGSWLESHDERDETSRKIGVLRRLQELGSEVLVLSADVTNRVEIEAAIDHAEARFGVIHGAIHCAGVPGGGLIQLKTKESAASVLRPKVDGAQILADLLAGKKCDFLALCSSLSSVVGGVGHVDYCAANAFMDSFAQARRHDTRLPIVSIDWNAWQGVGMAASLELPSDLKQWQQEIHNNGIKAKEGQEALARILASGLTQVAVSTEDLGLLIEQHFAYTPPGDAPGQRPTGTSHARPHLGVSFLAPRNDVERKIAEVWQQFLGVDEVGIHDNFFLLGGHSLLGTRLISRLRDTFDLDIPLRRLFDAPTVAGLAEIVVERQAEREEQETRRLLARLLTLDEREVEEELNKRAAAG